MDSDDTNVMFEIGVAEHPATKQRLEELTRQVTESQARMTQGVDRVGLAAHTVSAALVPITAQIAEFRANAVASVDELRSSITRLRAAAEMGVEVDVVVKGKAQLDEFAAKKNAGGKNKGLFNSPGTATIPKPDTSGIKDSFDELPASLRNVFKALGMDAKESADEIGRIFESRLAGVANTQALKDSYAKELATQTERFASTSKALDDALDQKGESVERLNGAMVKATRSVIGAAKGFAELGLVSKENSEEMLKGLVVIQGAFDIFDGAADLLESYGMGMKAVKQSTEAAAKASQLQKAMMGPQFALLRAYQAQLVAEAATANATTAANMRLNASRGGGIGGAAATVVGTVAQGATTAATTGASAAGAVGMFGGAFAKLGGAASGIAAAAAPAIGGLASIAGIATAVAGVAAAGALVTESLRGTAHKTNSWSNWLVGAAASVNRFTGLMHLSSDEYSNLARATRSLEKAQKRATLLTLENDIKRERDNLKSSAKNETAFLEFKTNQERLRLTAQNTGSFDARIGAEFAIQAQALTEIAKNQAIVDRSKAGEAVDPAEARAAQMNIDMFQQQVMQAQLRQNTEGEAGAGQRLAFEEDNRIKAVNALIDAEREVNALRAAGLEETKGYNTALENAKRYQGEVKTALEREMQLIKEKTELEVAGQSKVRDVLQSQIALKDQQIQKSRDGYNNSAIAFSKMGQIQQQQVREALVKARGGQALRAPELDLLEQVATPESKRLATEARLKKAKKDGFDDFGAGFDKEQQELLTAKKQLEAQVTTTYDVSVNLQSNLAEMVDAVIPQLQSLLDADREKGIELIERTLRGNLSTANQAFNDKFKEASKQKF